MMKGWDRRSGFSLLEIAVAIGITGLVLAGVVTAFSKVSKASRNATRGADLTNSTRGLAQLLQHDFAKAGKGLGDLNALNVKYKFVPPANGGIVAEAIPAPNLYGIANIEVDEDGFSEFVLQWFDYDISASSVGKNPSFIVDLSALQGLLGLFPISVYDDEAFLISNKDEHLESIQPGDIFLFYKNAVFAAADEFRNNAIWNAGLLDALGSPANGAVVLQVDTVGAVEDDASALGGGEYFKRVSVTFADDGIFSRNLTGFANPTLFETYGFIMANQIKDELRLPASTYMARKLGNANSFHRVHYKVEGSGNRRALIRIHNGTPEVVATGVLEFDVRLGLDIPNLEPQNVSRDDMDGFVSRLTSSAWTRGYSDNPFGISTDQFKVIIGRHAMAAEVYFTQRAQRKDTDDRDTPVKVRSFVQQFRVWNNALPVPNL